MKYEAEIDLRNGNTSHALLVELVGPDRRVLDVGCATGYLGRALQRRGCRVCGVELDPEAAEEAQLVLDDVLVGDVESLDLVGHFGKESFDVVVFGDVLEHLADPGTVLRKARPLLSESGAVVASVPNVAHGAVRLALLSGRFDYGPRGLLDATHLRFFTRESLHELFRESGLVPVDVRRTTAGIFDTEIPVRREDFDAGVVDAVEGDPESTTYQFVLRAVSEDSPEAIASRPGGPATAPPARCHLGVWADWAPGDLRTALEVRVTAAELARRLPGALVRPFSSNAASGPSPHDGGLAVEALGPWSPDAAASLAAQLDCAVVVGAVPAADEHAAGGPAGFLAEGLGADAEAECPVVWSAVRLPGGAPGVLERFATRRPYVSVVDGPGAPLGGSPDGSAVAVPDPLVLAPRLLGPEALGRRLEFARMMGWFPVRGRAVVVEVGSSMLPHAEAVAAALGAVAATGTSVVLVTLDDERGEAAEAADAVAAAAPCPVYRVPADALVDDVVAVVAGADAVAASTPSGLALALASGRPTAHVRLAGPNASRSPSLAALATTVTDPAELAPLAEKDRLAARPDEVAAVQAALDAHFDRIAAIADAAAALRARPPGPAVLLPPEHVAAMEAAHRRMQERLDAERRAVADHLAVVRVGHEAELRAVHARLDALAAERDALAARQQEAAGGVERQAELERRLAAVTAELEALKGIRILRLLRPARAVYARLRGGRL